MKARYTIIIFVLSLFFYTLTNYGGIRSPDSEVVYRVAESFASDLSFQVAKGLETLPGFGISRGKDGKLYAVFGPGQSILCAALIKLAKVLDELGLYKVNHGHPRLSHYYRNGLLLYLTNMEPSNVEPHALRSVIAFLYEVVSALGVVMFWLICCRMYQCLPCAYIITMLYALGTIIWPYAGTFFSEPLAILFLLICFYLLVGCEPAVPARRNNISLPVLLVAGICLGLSTATHLTAILFFPFFALYCWYCSYQLDRRMLAAVVGAGWFITGFCLVMLLLGYHNFARFGSFLETGRSAALGGGVSLGYGYFVAPWEGLYGLVLSPGKGIVLFCPAVVTAIFSWRFFHRDYPVLSLILAGSILFRLLFIASRSDWHGGYCLGPRYLVMLVPFLVIPAGFWLRRQFSEGNGAHIVLFGAFSLACIAQQVYFCLGEIFSYNHLIRFALRQRGIEILAGNRLYMEWGLSPLIHILSGKRGPFLLTGIPADNISLWAGITVSAAICYIVGCALLVRFHRSTVVGTTRNGGFYGEASD
jgi:hypothetical protein